LGRNGGLITFIFVLLFSNIAEWFAQIPLPSSFSAKTNSSFLLRKKQAEYVVESKRGKVDSGRASLGFSSNENVTIVKFASPAAAKKAR
jgi:hypothetical protein